MVNSSRIHKSPRKVLLITADQWRGDCLGYVGHPHVQTPNLDRLAVEGVIFLKHYNQAVPCGPSRASLLTGLYMMNHRCVNNGTPMDLRFTNVALESRKAGYDPTLFGYTDTSLDPRGLHPKDPSLKTYENLLPGMTSGVKVDDLHKPWIGWLKSRGYPSTLDHENVFLPVLKDLKADKEIYTSAPPLYDRDHSDTAFLTNSLLEWFSSHEGEDWFVHLSYLRPHPPWVAPEPFNTMYDPASMSLPLRATSIENEGKQHPMLPLLHNLPQRSAFFPGKSETPLAYASETEVRQAKATYFGLISEVDYHLGRIFDYLRTSEQYESTLILFTTDHGEQLGDHYLFNKGGYFDQSYHIPLIIRDPRNRLKNAKLRKVRRFTESIDLMPTILEWLDLEVPDQCDGLSLMPFLEGKIPHNWRQAVHFEYDFRLIGSHQSMIEQRLGLLPDQCSLAVIRDENYKYIHMTASPSLFFDLQKDPGEFLNRAEDPQYRELVLSYAQRMLSWMMNHRDRVLVNMNVESGNLIHWRGPRN